MNISNHRTIQRIILIKFHLQKDVNIYWTHHFQLANLIDCYWEDIFNLQLAKITVNFIERMLKST